MKMTVFWVVAPCSLFVFVRGLSGGFWVYLEGDVSSVSFYQPPRRNIPEDSHLHTRRRENM
jgi:hypothetical protein